MKNGARHSGWISGAIMLAGLTGCTTLSGQARMVRDIENLLGGQARDWNRGDIEAFMQPYWHSQDLTFSSEGHVTRGWQSTLDNYRKRYPSRNAMGRLTFDHLEIIEIGNGAALVLGRWRLERNDPVGGVFTLVLRRHSDRWIIIHDHTSRDARTVD